MKAKSSAFIYDINRRWTNPLVYSVIVGFALSNLLGTF